MYNADSKEIPSDIGSRLDPERNYHWSGVDRMLELQRHLPRVLVGEYVEWFLWYMRYQRFRAFQTIILVDPASAICDKDVGGFIDGLLARLLRRAPQVVVVTRGAASRVPELDAPRLKEMLMAMLYGTRLSRAELAALVQLAFVLVPDEALRQTLEQPWWRARRDYSRYKLREEDEELVQGLVPDREPRNQGGPRSLEQFFKRSRNREYVRPEDKWVEAELLALVREKGWLTTASISKHFQERYEEYQRAQTPPPAEAYPHYQRERRSQVQVFLASPSVIRSARDRLVMNSLLTKHVWYREVGRPAMVYVEPGHDLPFKEGANCGQCAFYDSAKTRCRVWWLASRKHRYYDQRWKQPASGVSEFEIHKMRYSLNVGPHSSACLRFVDKKRDHFRKMVPNSCEVCGGPILKTEENKSVVCRVCGTKYAPMKSRVKVLTSYEHEFRRLYIRITGSNPDDDLRDWKAEVAKRPLVELERSLELDSGPNNSIALGESEPEPTKWVTPTFNPSLQLLVDKKAKNGETSRMLSLAMVESARNATRRIGLIASLGSDVVNSAIRRQEMYLSLARETPVGKLLTFEAHAMAQYWSCYDLALEPALQWFGPRKRSRFVAEYVEDPGGRAKGYSAVHAAVNYLHQRRLRRAVLANAEVGFQGACDGFLHRERYHSRHMGLLFDMIDPFKFADREGLLAVALNRGITWRDFKMGADRRSSTFYYPASSARSILDQIGIDADQLIVRYQGIETNLTDAYKQFATSLLGELQEGREFEPFVYVPI
jgi:hypothetical protein